MNRLFTLAGTSLSLIALYLLLRNAFGATSLLREAGAATVAIFRTLQGR
jgi:hypothetical protein